MSEPLLLPALDSLIPKLAACQYFTCDKYVSLATFSGDSFFQMLRLTNFQLADLQLAYSQTRRLAHYPDSSLCYIMHGTRTIQLYNSQTRGLQFTFPHSNVRCFKCVLACILDIALFYHVMLICDTKINQSINNLTLPGSPQS